MSLRAVTGGSPLYRAASTPSSILQRRLSPCIPGDLLAGPYKQARAVQKEAGCRPEHPAGWGQGLVAVVAPGLFPAASEVGLSVSGPVASAPWHVHV